MELTGPTYANLQYCRKMNGGEFVQLIAWQSPPLIQVV